MEFMLVQIYTKLKENLLIKTIRKILDSKFMMLSIVVLAAISNICGLEIPVFYFYTFVIILATLFCDDMLSLLPIACCGYMTFSKSNNPLSKEQTSVFLTSDVITHMYIIGITIACFAISRIIFDFITHKERRQKPKFLYGFIALGLAYILGGLLSGSYNYKTAFFGLIEILTLFFTYFCFYFSVDWKKVNKNYFPLLFTLIGFLMVAEVFNMLLNSGIFNISKAFNRKELYTGWGHYNNIASVFMFCIPAPFYFALTKKNGWVYSLISTLFLVFLLLNQSRNGMLMGTIIYCLCAFITLIKTKGKERFKHTLTYISIISIILLLLIFFKDQLLNIFYSVHQKGADDSGRIEIYIGGLKQYIESPIFGKGFYECDAYRWGIPYTEGSFLPPRYHNTYVQILASCGSVGILAYLYHRFETVKLLWKNKNIGNLIISIALLGFIMICMFDCHFHNLGPGFLYSALLLFMEKLYGNENKQIIN